MTIDRYRDSLPNNRGQGIASVFLMLIVVGLCLVAGLTKSAEAQGVVCGPHQSLHTHLTEKYKQVPVSFMMDANGTVMTTYANTLGSTWTLLRVHPNGASCIIGSGKMYRQIAPPKGPSTES